MPCSLTRLITHLFSSAADQRRPLLVNLSLVLLDRFSKTGALEK